MHAIDTAHGCEGANAAGKAAGQLLHLADLALMIVYRIDCHAKRRSRVDLVNVLALGKDF